MIEPELYYLLIDMLTKTRTFVSKRIINMHYWDFDRSVIFHGNKGVINLHGNRESIDRIEYRAITILFFFFLFISNITDLEWVSISFITYTYSYKEIKPVILFLDIEDKNETYLSFAYHCLNIWYLSDYTTSRNERWCRYVERCRRYFLAP